MKQQKFYISPKTEDVRLYGKNNVCQDPLNPIYTYSGNGTPGGGF